MLVVGLTGSIGMGKSTVAARFLEHGTAVFSADAEVHRLYAGAAAPAIEAAFPGTVVAGSVDRAALARVLGQDALLFAKLEAIVHPLVWQAERGFLQTAARNGDDLAVLEVPLLYEGGGENRVDAVIVVSASSDVQRHRVLARPGMTAARLDTLLARQMPDAEKRKRADFVVDTNGSMAHTLDQTDAIIVKLKCWPARAYDRFWT